MGPRPSVWADTPGGHAERRGRPPQLVVCEEAGEQLVHDVVRYGGGRGRELLGLRELSLGKGAQGAVHPLHLVGVGPGVLGFRVWDLGFGVWDWG